MLPLLPMLLYYVLAAADTARRMAARNIAQINCAIAHRANRAEMGIAAFRYANTAGDYRWQSSSNGCKHGVARGQQPVWGKAKRMVAGPFSSVSAPRPYRHAVFASEAKYEQSVASVVARIRSGQVKARSPEEE